LFGALHDLVCLVFRSIVGFGCREFLARVNYDLFRESPLRD
jgi:hypothetical protein